MREVRTGVTGRGWDLCQTRTLPGLEISKGRWIRNYDEQHRDHMSLCNLEIKWQMEFHMDKVMRTLNKTNKSQFHLKIDMP